jgi:hypothetical protein
MEILQIEKNRDPLRQAGRHKRDQGPGVPKRSCELRVEGAVSEKKPRRRCGERRGPGTGSSVSDRHVRENDLGSGKRRFAPAEIDVRRADVDPRRASEGTLPLADGYVARRDLQAHRSHTFLQDDPLTDRSHAAGNTRTDSVGRKKRQAGEIAP